MLSPRENFKVGVLARCAAAGLDAAQTHQVVKSALDKLAILGSLLDLGSKAGLAGGLALAAGPPLVGAGLGYGLGMATDYNDTDVKDIKDQEVLDSYRQHTQQLRRQKALRDYLRARKQTGRFI